MKKYVTEEQLRALQKELLNLREEYVKDSADNSFLCGFNFAIGLACGTILKEYDQLNDEI